MIIPEAVRRRNSAGTFAVCVLLLFCCCFSAAEDRPLAHFYSVNDPNSWESLRNNTASVGLLSPDWFTIDQQLQLQSSVDPALVAWAQARGIRLMPLLTNFKFDGHIVHALLNNPEKQQVLINSLIQSCVDGAFWGIQLDFENVMATDRELFVRFSRSLARALHVRRLAFSVAVPAPVQLAPPDPAQPGTVKWRPSDSAAGFDYHALGKTADLVTVMTYDENVAQPGPIAGIGWVEACIRAMLRTTPRKKLLLGVALYYRHWSRPSPQTTLYAVTEGPYQEAFLLAREWNARPDLDPVAQELRFSYDNQRGNHVVWLSDAGTLRQRLLLAKRYKLRGFSAWRLGQEDPVAWQSAFSERRRKNEN